MKKLPLRYAQLEPKVFSLLVRSRRGVLLYLGVHHSLDSAYDSAVAAMRAKLPQTQNEEVNIDLWTCMAPEDAVRELLEDVPLVEDTPVEPINLPGIPVPVPGRLRRPLTVRKERIKTAVNEEQVKKSLLMQKIIDSGDLKLLEENRKFLSKPEIRFVETAILSKDTKETPDQK